MTRTITSVTGLADLQSALQGITGALRKRILRNALAAGGRVVRDAARRLAPVLQTPVHRRGKVIRKPGTLKKAISVRTSKRAAREGNVGVFVNVRPAKNAKFRGGKLIRAKTKGAHSPDDPYYWQWLEFGRAARAGAGARSRIQRVVRRIGGRRVELVKGQRARRARRAVGAIAAMRFLQRSAAVLPQALTVITRQVGPEIARLNRRRPG